MVFFVGLLKRRKFFYWRITGYRELLRLKNNLLIKEKNMKKKIVLSALALALAATMGLAYSVSADETGFGPFKRGFKGNLTEEQRLKMQERFGAHMGVNLTDEKRSELQAEREARWAERDTQREAAQAAIEAGDYLAWKAVVGDNHPLADKITEANFARFVEAHKHMESAQAIFTELGIERGGHGPRGPGMGPMGAGRGGWNK